MTITPYLRTAQFHETDQMGVIHHANYIRWFEESRVDFMAKAGYGYERAVEAGIDFAVLGVTCDYKSMVRFGDTVAITCVITQLSASRMTVGYTIHDAGTGELRTRGESRHCFYSGARGRPVSLKKEMPELYALFEILRDQSKKS
jgi:acyl-CoA thioester hydrolase